jgi:hypothetical protein
MSRGGFLSSLRCFVRFVCRLCIVSFPRRIGCAWRILAILFEGGGVTDGAFRAKGGRMVEPRRYERLVNGSGEVDEKGVGV